MGNLVRPGEAQDQCADAIVGGQADRALFGAGHEERGVGELHGAGEDGMGLDVQGAVPLELVR